LQRYNQAWKLGKLGLYDEELVEFVGERFEEEIEYFGFNSPL